MADKTVNWVGGKVPRDEPDCGFDGSKCKFHMGTAIVIHISKCRCSLVDISLWGYAVKYM